MVITVETLNNVTWVPSQALFESDGRKFVYLQDPKGFMPHDVTLVRRSESQAVVTGINEGERRRHVQSRSAEQAGAGQQSARKPSQRMKALRK